MPEALHAQLLAARTAVVPDLLAVLEDEQPEHGWAPLHAARLLDELGDVRAVPGLLRCLERCDKLDSLAQQITDTLVKWGQLAIAECLEAYPMTDDDTRDSIAFILSRCGTPDERIYNVLLDTLERSPVIGANCLVDYGDPRALPALSQRFDALPIGDEESLFANHVFVELRCAIEDLGGQLTAEQEVKANKADAPRRRFAAQMEGFMRHSTAPPQRVKKAPSPSIDTGSVTRKQHELGRNERCWCGSGKKYKKCHLDLDH